MEHYQKTGETMSSVRFSANLQEELTPLMWSCRRGFLYKDIRVHHDKARPHIADETLAAIWKCDFRSCSVLRSVLNLLPLIIV